jgi:hypothetical protein
VLDRVRTVDVARGINGYPAEGSASPDEVPLPVEEVVLTEDYGTPVEARGVVSLLVMCQLVEAHMSVPETQRKRFLLEADWASCSICLLFRDISA